MKTEGTIVPSRRNREVGGPWQLAPDLAPWEIHKGAAVDCCYSLAPGTSPCPLRTVGFVEKPGSASPYRRDPKRRGSGRRSRKRLAGERLAVHPPHDARRRRGHGPRARGLRPAGPRDSAATLALVRPESPFEPVDPRGSLRGGIGRRPCVLARPISTRSVERRPDERIRPRRARGACARFTGSPPITGSSITTCAHSKRGSARAAATGRGCPKQGSASGRLAEPVSLG